MIRTPAHKQRDPNMLPATVADWPLPKIEKASEPLQTPIDPPGYMTLAGYVQRVQRQERAFPETVEIDTRLLETIASCLYGKYSYLSWEVQKVLDKAR